MDNNDILCTCEHRECNKYHFPDLCIFGNSCNLRRSCPYWHYVPKCPIWRCFREHCYFNHSGLLSKSQVLIVFDKVLFEYLKYIKLPYDIKNKASYYLERRRRERIFIQVKIRREREEAIKLKHKMELSKRVTNGTLNVLCEDTIGLIIKQLDLCDALHFGRTCKNYYAKIYKYFDATVPNARKFLRKAVVQMTAPCTVFSEFFMKSPPTACIFKYIKYMPVSLLLSLFRFSNNEIGVNGITVQDLVGVIKFFVQHYICTNKVEIPTIQHFQQNIDNIISYRSESYYDPNRVFLAYETKLMFELFKMYWDPNAIKTIRHMCKKTSLREYFGIIWDEQWSVSHRPLHANDGNITTDSEVEDSDDGTSDDDTANNNNTADDDSNSFLSDDD